VYKESDADVTIFVLPFLPFASCGYLFVLDFLSVRGILVIPLRLSAVP